MKLGLDRHGFTVVELVFVIVLVGILSTVAIRKLSSSDTSLYEARDQIINHLRYAQHLAMNDDKYLASKEIAKFSSSIHNGSDDAIKAMSHDWQSRMWRLQFHNIKNGCEKKYESEGWTYSVYSENPRASGAYDNNPAGYSTIAKDPLTGKCISHYNANNLPGYCAKVSGSGGNCKISNDNRDKNLKLNQKFGIVDIEIKSAGCNAKSPVIYFDSNGAPYCGSGKVKLTKPLAIKIKKSTSAKDDNTMAIICVAPETGYIWHLTKATTSSSAYTSNNNPCE